MTVSLRKRKECTTDNTDTDVVTQELKVEGRKGVESKFNKFLKILAHVQSDVAFLVNLGQAG